MKKGNVRALLPILVFLAIYLGLGITFAVMLLDALCTAFPLYAG